MDEKWNTNIKSQPLLGLISEALSDDSFSYSDTLNILTSAASEGFSSAEIDDLKYIYSQNSFESDYVKNITYNVVFENVGNDYWWGGTTDISSLVKLGNATPGITQSKANLLIDKWFLGKDLPMPISGGDTANPAATSGKYDYGTISGELFTGGVTALDVNQGSAGTCYLIASMESIAALNPSIIENAFIENPNGTYGVKFFFNGEPIYTTVNKQIPVTSWNTVNYAGNQNKSLAGESWASLLEKAYVQANSQVNLKYSSQWSNAGTTEYRNSYQFMEGGLAYTLGQITGDTYDLFSYGNWSWPGDYKTLTNEKDASKIKQNIIDALEAGGIGWIASWGASYRKNGEAIINEQFGSKQELVGGHAFALHGYDADTDTFIISNPWPESSSGSYYNTTFKLPIEFFWSSHFDPLIGITNPSSTKFDFNYDISANSSASNDAMLEGSAIKFTITRDNTGQESTVYLSTDHATTSNGDIVELNKTSLTFNRDETVKTIEISTLSDDLIEDTESFTLNLYKSQNSSTADASVTAFIANVTPASFNYSLNSNGSTGENAVTEGSNINLTITRDGSGSASTVYLSTLNQTTSNDDLDQLSYKAVQFAAKETVKTVNISTYEDTKVEGVETVELQLYGGPSESSSIAATIVNVQDIWNPEFSYIIYSDASTEEAAANEGSVITFNVVRSFTGSNSTAYLKTFFNNAMSNDLVDANDLKLNFAANETHKTFTVTVTEDLWLETTESFGYKLYTSETSTTAEAKGIAFIKDKVFDEFEYTLTSNDLANPTIDEGNTLVLSIMRDGDGRASEVYVSTRNGTANSADYAVIDRQKIIFNQKDTVKNIEIQTYGDDIIDDEFFWIDLYLNENDINPAYSTKIDIKDVQQSQNFNYQVSNTTINEGETAAFTITRDGSGESSTVWLATSHATADSDDYATLELTGLTFSAKETEKSISIETYHDSLSEGAEPEYFWLDLYKEKSDYISGDYAAYGYADITDVTSQDTNNYTYTISSEDGNSVSEGATATFTITRSASGTSSTVYVNTIEGTADGSDYEGLTTTAVSFNEKETTKTVTVNTYTDSSTEDSEYFYLALYDTVADAQDGNYQTWDYAYISDGSGSADVSYTYSVDSVSVAEGETATFTISRDGSSTASSVYVNTSAYTADSSDLNFITAQQVTFDVGETSKSVSVETYTDSIQEGDEYYYLDVFASQVDAQDGWDYIAWGDGTITDGSGSANVSFAKIAQNNQQNSAVKNTFYGHDGTEFQNAYAFAVLKDDGTLDVWGDNNNGGDVSAINSSLTGVTKVFSNHKSFAALKNDGSVVVWGNSDTGGDQTTISSKLNGTIDVTSISSTKSSFAALREDGSVVTWGSPGSGGNYIDGENRTDITNIYSNANAFAALTSAGSIISWGQSSFGGDGNTIPNDASATFSDIFSTSSAFAAIKSDGSVFAWGNENDGGDSSSVASQLDGTIDVTAISSTASSFAALKADGSVVTWGNFASGANSSGVASNIDGKVGVTKIYSTDYAFAALRSDGSVITWGDQTLGGDSSAVSQALNGSNPVQHIYANSTAFLAVHQDNTITTWGFASHGGDSASVADQFNSNKTIKSVAVSQAGFSVLFDEGSFVTWGDFADDDTARISDLTSANNIESISSNNSAFYAIDSTGNTIAWGDLSEGGTYTPQDANSYTLTSTTVTRSGANLSEVTLTITSNGSSNTYTTSEAPITTTSTSGSSLSIGATLDYAISSKAINSQDALDALRLSVGMDTQNGTRSAFDYIAADFNQDGKVTSADALEILKYSVGLATTKEASWKFVDTTANLDSISRSNTSLDEGKILENLSADTSVSLTGILVGDVNDTYSGLIA